jgi:hypothetical protein
VKRAFALLALLLTGCPGTSLTTCNLEPDITGHWTISVAADGGANTIEADLIQRPRPGSSLGALVWGTLTSDDKGWFDSVMIPELVMNNGSKTGAIVGCSLRINVPVTTMVTDDDVDQSPLRLALVGAIVQKGMMMGDPSTVIRVDSMMPETFTWSAVQR